jgi:hypothetical protein
MRFAPGCVLLRLLSKQLTNYLTMVRVPDYQNSTQVSAKASATAKGVLVLFLLVVVLPIVLKATGHTRLAAWPWVKVTAALWIPWALLGLMSAIGWAIHGAQTLRRRA